ncbi:histone-like nucleoid-structuring protein Lsr2 [Streptomyces sp. MMS24-I29]|uniref:histone-like nucleoid-structuring protein Lsr2 n=1 Tax=Streptomyces sp. MMS24-I29 TaxID=3351480 RepID=UPI003C7E7A69
MATEFVSVTKSDLTGERDAATVTFGLEGEWYEIDLTDKEKAKLRDILKPYVGKGRKPKRKPRKLDVRETTPEERVKIRDWAREEGLDVSEFGMIPKPIVDAYDEAHGKARKAKVASEDVSDLLAPDKIRAWGKEQGFEFADFGRIPKKVVEAYCEAHGIERDK